VSVCKELRNREEEERETQRDWGMACFNYCEALDFSQRVTGTSPPNPRDMTLSPPPPLVFPLFTLSLLFLFILHQQRMGE